MDAYVTPTKMAIPYGAEIVNIVLCSEGIEGCKVIALLVEEENGCMRWWHKYTWIPYTWVYHFGQQMLMEAQQNAKLILTLRH